MPWLVGTALLHCALVVERRHALVNWTLLLSILAFTLSLIGTFLVRSGILTSVHAFAVDPARGVFILAMVLGASGGALTLYALRAQAPAAAAHLRTRQPRGRDSREQLPAAHRLCGRLPRHLLSAGDRRALRRQDFGRPALFQHHLRPDHAWRHRPDGVRTNDALAQRLGAADGQRDACANARRARRRPRRGCRRPEPRGRTWHRLRRLPDRRHDALDAGTPADRTSETAAVALPRPRFPAIDMGLHRRAPRLRRRRHRHYRNVGVGDGHRSPPCAPAIPQRSATAPSR